MMASRLAVAQLGRPAPAAQSSSCRRPSPLSWTRADARAADPEGQEGPRALTASWRHLSGPGAVLLAHRAHRQRSRRRRRTAARAQASGDASLSAPSAETVSAALAAWRAEDEALKRYLEEDAVLLEEYMAMAPHVYESQTIEQMVADVRKTWWEAEYFSSPKQCLNLLKEKRLSVGSVFHTLPCEGGTLALCVLELPCGVVCGLAAHSKAYLAEHLAAKKALRRIIPAKFENFFGGDALGAAKTDEAVIAAQSLLSHVGVYIQDANVTLFQPCGVQWKAIVHGTLLGESIADNSAPLQPRREEATIFSAMILVHRIREILGVDEDDPDDPEEWARELALTAPATVEGAMRSGQASLELGQLGTGDDEDLLRELLGTDEELAEREAALEAASQRHERRMSYLQEMRYLDDMPYEERVVARRLWEVTKQEDEEWRREEVKGKLPAEQARETISRALEHDQVVIVSGGTGSGKSTQIPQFLLDDFRGWEVETPGSKADAPLDLEPGSAVEVHFEKKWYRCHVLEAADDRKTITAKYFEGGDEERDIDVETRVRAIQASWTKVPPKIAVTQPRRIAATSLATRVAWERFAEECGGEIGYRTRGNSLVSSSETGNIDYVTTGVLLRMMVKDPTLSWYNVVVLDEVHERQEFADLLLILLRDLLPRRPDLRVVLMSATLDSACFQQYFPGSAVIEIPLESRFPVEEIHLEDPFFEQFEQTGPLMQEESKAREGAVDYTGDYDFATGSNRQGLEEKEHDGYSSAVLSDQVTQLCRFREDARQALAQFKKGKHLKMERWDPKDLIAFLEAQEVRPWKPHRSAREVSRSMRWWGRSSNKDTAENTLIELCEQVILNLAPELLNNHKDDGHPTGSILVFLPGWFEILCLSDALALSAPDNLWVLKLHSTVEQEEQQMVFEEPEEGKVKVILATNIAESSVTISDVEVVIDFGLQRELNYSPETRVSKLETAWLCKSNATQRKGRAGRVRPGRIFRLYTREQFDFLPLLPAPELLRADLCTTCLYCISQGNDPRDFLSKAPDAPSVAYLEAAMWELAAIDAIKDGMQPKMMPLGNLLQCLPMTPTMGRALVLGTIFSIPQKTACALVISQQQRTVFHLSQRLRWEQREAAKALCPYSDIIASLRAIEEFEKIVQARGYLAAEKWCEKYFMNYQLMVDISREKYQLFKDVMSTGLLDANACEDQNPDEWGWLVDDDEEWEASSAAANFEETQAVQVEAQEDSRHMARKEWIETMSAAPEEDDDERLLVGIMCNGFPTNVAKRGDPDEQSHQTLGSEKAQMSLLSVNAFDENAVDGLPNPSWWHFTTNVINRGGEEVHMQNSSLISPWHVALFAGMREGETPNSQIELDRWIVLEEDSRRSDLVRRLRQEIQHALVWASISTTWDKVAQAALRRSKALMRCLSATMLGKPMEQADVDLLRRWRLPDIQDGEMTVGVEEADGPTDAGALRAMLNMKTVGELRALLRDMSADTSGKRKDLVSRCVKCLLEGAEEAANVEAMDVSA